MKWRKRTNASMPTVIQNESNLRQFCIFARNCDLTEVTEGMVLDYLELLKDGLKVQNNSLIPKVNALRQFLKYWNERGTGVLSYFRVPLQKKEFTMPRLCTKEEFDKFWAEVTKKTTNNAPRVRNAALIGLLSATGIRNGEACSILLKDMDVNTPIQAGGEVMYRGVIKTEKSRGMRPFREIFWNEDVNEMLKKWIERREGIRKVKVLTDPGHLFVGLNSRIAKTAFGRRLTPNSVDELFRIYSRKSGVDINPHMLRHLLGRDMAEGDASDHVISDVLGHSRLDSSRTYTRLFGKAVGKQFARFRGNNRRVTI